ncbi:MAG: 4-(cytidine 5'-diphospho)-2-C-methyl-D-erythritol kinase [Fimbriimonadaceae bacterium]|nr:4-(cytidine 5'-diphospho)-2-C-methyl-D-erythritol kinase [Fimbriimonadaceae bacterium]
MRWRIACPAKVNLFLAVGPPFPNGYHPLRTVFQAVSLFDEVAVEEAKEDQISSDWEELPVENTLAKTLRLAREVAQVSPLAIRLTKRIPSEAGLGGGSSDAAGLLKILHQMNPERFPLPVMMKIAAEVGADVPFFLVGGLATAEGIGEQLSTLDEPPARTFLIVKPKVGISTREAYQALDRRGDYSLYLSGSLPDFSSSSAAPWGESLKNDFELVAPEEIERVKSALTQSGARASLMSGSGSAVFGLFESPSHAIEAEPFLLGLGEVFMARSVSRGEDLWIS